MDEQPIKPIQTESQTEIITRTEATKYTNGAGSVAPDSRIFGVSIMAWTLLLLMVTVCFCNLFQLPIYDHLVNLSLVAIGFYAGNKK
jgi:hypothetical protein